MADTFMNSFNQGLNLAHTIENDKRLQQVAQMQQQMQMMQMQKMAQDMAATEFLRQKMAEKGEEVPGQTLLSNTTQQGGYRDAGASTADIIQRTTTPSTYKPTPFQQSVGSGFQDSSAAIELGRAGVPLEHIRNVLPQVKADTTNNLEALLVQKVKRGEMTLQEAIKAKRRKRSEG